jgi:hypothetical protein
MSGEAAAAVTEYSEDDWQESAGHRPLPDVDVNQVFLLHRHWICANLQRTRFQEKIATMAKPDGGAFLADEGWASMYLWYSLLWSVIEGFKARDIDLRGPLAADIETLADPLRRCRNAVLHVSPTNQHDKRLYELLQVPDVVEKIRRVSTGFGRMFIEESQARKREGRLGP